MASNLGAGQDTLQFIDLSTVEPQKGSQGVVVAHNNFLIRSHVAKRNRRQAKGAQAELKRLDLDSQPPSTSPRAYSTVTSRPREVKAERRRNRQVSTDQAPESLHPHDTPAAAVEAIHLDQSWTNRHTAQRSMVARTTSPSPRSLSPFFGALPVGAFDPSVQAAELVSYLLDIIFPANCFLSPEDDRPQWFRAFCEQPIIFHGSSFTCMVHRNHIGIHVSAVEKQRTLAHRGMAIRLINEKIANLTDADADIELVMIGMIAISPDYGEDPDSTSNTKSLFVPHMEWAECVNIYGRFDSAVSHRKALMTLANRRGGIEHLRIPGLRKSIAIHDLILASNNCEKPDYPWLRTVDPYQLLQSGTLGSSSDRGWVPASGFLTHVPNGLTASLRTILRDISCVDYLMAQCRSRRLSETEFELLMMSRDYTHHRLLGLSRWDELGDIEREGGNAALYECCRITAILYSHAVIFPQQAQTDGILKPLQDLRRTIEISNLINWSRDVSTLLIWSLLISAIAAYRTSHRKFYVTMLRKVVQRMGVTSIQAALGIANQFIWSDAAGEQGARVLWDALEIDEAR